MTTLFFQSALLPDGWADNVRVSIGAGRISAVETGASPTPQDERHALALPGLCNVHSHGFQRGMAGLTERRGGPAGDNFWTWREVMYRFLERLTPEDVESITAQAYAEMLEGGFTRVAEFHYLHNDSGGARYADPATLAGSVSEAATQTGIGLTLLPVFYAHSDFGGEPPAPGQRRFISSVDDYVALLEASARRLKGDATLGASFHSLRAATIEEIGTLMPHASGPIHMHVAEQVKEVEACVARHGARPMDFLFDNIAVDERWCLIHSTHITETETKRLAASGAVAGLCPVTEGNLGDGIFPADAYLKQGGRLGVGTDSNVLICAAQELRAIEYSQRLSLRARAVLADEATPSVGRRLFDSAVRGGAQALGVAAGITQGASADIVSLNTEHPSLADRRGDVVLDSWIFGTRDRAIDCVWRHGDKVVSDGRHRIAAAIAERYRKTVARMVA